MNKFFFKMRKVKSSAQSRFCF